MPLINCKINLILTWSANYVMVSIYKSNLGVNICNIRYKRHVFAVTLSTQNNATLLLQLKSFFKEELAGINIPQDQSY